MHGFTPWPDACSVSFVAINTIRPSANLQQLLDTIQRVSLVCSELLHGIFIELESQSRLLVQSHPTVR